MALVRGGEGLRRRLARMKTAVRAESLAAAGEDAGEVVAEEAQATAPVLSGHLRSRINVVVVQEGEARVVVSIGVNLDEVPYARRIEFGFQGADRLGRVYHQPAQAYLRPAIDGRKREAIRVFVARLRREWQ